MDAVLRDLSKAVCSRAILLWFLLSKLPLNIFLSGFLLSRNAIPTGLARIIRSCPKLIAALEVPMASRLQNLQLGAIVVGPRLIRSIPKLFSIVASQVPTAFYFSSHPKFRSAASFCATRLRLIKLDWSLSGRAIVLTFRKASCPFRGGKFFPSRGTVERQVVGSVTLPSITLRHFPFHWRQCRLFSDFHALSFFSQTIEALNFTYLELSTVAAHLYCSRFLSWSSCSRTQPFSHSFKHLEPLQGSSIFRKLRLAELQKL